MRLVHEGMWAVTFGLEETLRPGGNDDGNSIGEGVGGEGEEDWECEKVGGEHAESS